MASPIQTVIGKGTSNPLIAEGLLKILKEIKCACFAKNFFIQSIPDHTRAGLGLKTLKGVL